MAGKKDEVEQRLRRNGVCLNRIHELRCEFL